MLTQLKMVTRMELLTQRKMLTAEGAYAVCDATSAMTSLADGLTDRAMVGGERRSSCLEGCQHQRRRVGGRAGSRMSGAMDVQTARHSEDAG